MSSAGLSLAYEAQLQWSFFDLGIGNVAEAKRKAAEQLISLADQIARSNANSGTFDLIDDLTGIRLGRVRFVVGSPDEDEE